LIHNRKDWKEIIIRCHYIIHKKEGINYYIDHISGGREFEWNKNGQKGVLLRDTDKNIDEKELDKKAEEEALTRIKQFLVQIIMQKDFSHSVPDSNALNGNRKLEFKISELDFKERLPILFYSLRDKMYNFNNRTIRFFCIFLYFIGMISIFLVFLQNMIYVIEKIL